MSRRRAAGNTATIRRPRRFAPERDDVIDATALLLLGIIAFVEFRTTFSGWNFLGVAVLGIALGLLIAHLANVLRQPVIVLIAMGVGAFFLLGGAVALHGAPGASAAPTSTTLHQLASGSVDGWRELLTTVPPVASSGPLLVLPYMMGLFLGLGGFALARRLRGAVRPVLAPLAVFIAVIVLGSLSPGRIVPIATVFALTALGWVAVRHQRRQHVAASGSEQVARAGIAVALFAVAGVGAYFVGPNLPGSESNDRVVLRKYVVPPFNIGDYPSPLGEFRLYAQDRTVGNQTLGLKDKVLFQVSGTLPAGAPIVFGVLDSYNGSVWAATNQAGTIDGRPDSFLRVGQKLDNPAAGPTYTMRVTPAAYDDYWLPTAGAVQTVSFTGAQAAQDSADFRYNLDTGTGIVPEKVGAGDTYSMTVAGVTPKELTSSDPLAGGADPTAGAFIRDAEQSLAGAPTSLAGELLTLAGNLKQQGKYTDGDAGTGFEYYLPGHSVGRLTDFVKGVIPGVKYVGDDEQYAAAYALMIEQLGVPARVVVGVESLPSSGAVHGSDVQAWVQVRAADGDWLSIPSSAFTSTTPPDKQQIQQPVPQDAGAVVPPPAQGHPKSSLDNTAVSSSDSRGAAKHTQHAGFALPGWLLTTVRIAAPPIAVILIVGATIIGVKAWRRRRRRTRGAPATRLALGWREVTDYARDLGATVRVIATRSEQADDVNGPGLLPLAALADSHIFGPDPVSDADARTFWQRVQAERRQMSRASGRWRRWVAAVNLVTFFGRTSDRRARSRSGAPEVAG